MFRWYTWCIASQQRRIALIPIAYGYFCFNLFQRCSKPISNYFHTEYLVGMACSWCVQLMHTARSIHSNLNKIPFEYYLFFFGFVIFKCIFSILSLCPSFISSLSVVYRFRPLSRIKIEFPNIFRRINLLVSGPSDHSVRL